MGTLKTALSAAEVTARYLVRVPELPYRSEVADRTSARPDGLAAGGCCRWAAVVVWERGGFQGGHA